MKFFLTIPTYNERDNIGPLLSHLLKNGHDMEVIVVDDDSPDRTWEVVEEMARRDSRLRLLHRKEDKGRGKAGVDAFRYALDRGAEVIIEMDADFSHDPRYIPSFLEQIKTHDMVIGSRLVKDGKDVGRSILRKALTYFSNLYIRTWLGLPVKDCTSGFRCFRRRVLEEVDLQSLRASGPAIVEELLFRAHKKGFSICEVPITFSERRAGSSSLSLRRLLEVFLTVLRLRWSLSGHKKT